MCRTSRLSVTFPGITFAAFGSAAIFAYSGHQSIGGLGLPFHFCHPFDRGSQSIAAQMHRRCPGVIGLSRETKLHPRLSSNAFDNSQRQPLSFQHRPLLDSHFNEAVNVGIDGCISDPRRIQSEIANRLIDGNSTRIRKRKQGRIKCACNRSAAEERHSKSHTLFLRKGNHFYSQRQLAGPTHARNPTPAPAQLPARRRTRPRQAQCRCASSAPTFSRKHSPVNATIHANCPPDPQCVVISRSSILSSENNCCAVMHRPRVRKRLVVRPGFFRKIGNPLADVDYALCAGSSCPYQLMPAAGAARKMPHAVNQVHLVASFPIRARAT